MAMHCRGFPPVVSAHRGHQRQPESGAGTNTAAATVRAESASAAPKPTGRRAATDPSVQLTRVAPPIAAESWEERPPGAGASDEVRISVRDHPRPEAHRRGQD